MSDTMLHGILQMPPELWTNDAIDIAQRHGRYFEASKRIIELERQLDWALKSREAVWDSWSKALQERDEARMERDELRKNSLALVEELKKSVIRLAKERDEARRERNEAREELARVRKELIRLIRRWKRREEKYLNAVTPAFQSGDKCAGSRYYGESIATHWAIEDLELLAKRKEEA